MNSFFLRTQISRKNTHTFKLLIIIGVLSAAFFKAVAADSQKSIGMQQTVSPSPDTSVYAIFSEAAGAATPPDVWSFYWNAFGEVTNRDSWESLVWTGDQWKAEGDTSLCLHSRGGAAGSSAGGGDTDRYAIASFIVKHPGDYQVGMAWIEVSSGGNGVLLKVFAGGELIHSRVAKPGFITRFEQRLPGLDPGDEIVVAVGPNGDPYNDQFNMDFHIALATPGFDGLPSFRVSDYGAMGDGSTDDLLAFHDAVDASIQAGGGIVVLDPGKTYRIVGDPEKIDTVFRLTECRNIKIEGNGAKLLLDPPNRICTVDRSENIEVNGLVIDYDPLPYYQGSIDSVNIENLFVDITVFDRYKVPDLSGTNKWEFGRVFRPKIPDDPLCREGDGMHLWIKDIVTLDATGRKLRILALNNDKNVLQMARDGGTEVIVPDRKNGHVGSWSFTIHSSSRILLKDIRYYCTPVMAVTPIDNFGPVTIINTDILIPERDIDGDGKVDMGPHTELFVSWRDYSMVMDNRFGVLYQDGDFDTGCMYDDLHNFTTHHGVVQSATEISAVIKRGAYAHATWKAGDWISIWSPHQLELKGVARLVSPASFMARNLPFGIEFDRPVPGILASDWIINEEQMNRNTVVRNYRTSTIGTFASIRQRTPTVYENCTFHDLYIVASSETDREGGRPTGVEFRNCYLEGGETPWGVVNLVHATDWKFINCVFDNSWIQIQQQSDSIMFRSCTWINQQGNKNAMTISGSSPVYIKDCVVKDDGGSTLDLLSKIAFVKGSSSKDIVWSDYPGSGPSKELESTQIGTENAGIMRDADPVTVVFPNPSTGLLNIQCQKDMHVSLINSQGISILQSRIEKDTNLSLDITGSSSGLYLCRFSDGMHSFSRKILLVRD